MQYNALRKQMRWMKAPPLYDLGGEYNTLEDLVDDFGTWGGTIGLVMTAMMKTRYECPDVSSCRSSSTNTVPFLPRSYIHFLNEIKAALRDKDEICFALDNNLPEDADKFGARWFIPGVD
ncbi:hypothetical protein CDD81_719 [Ophiocordyceps australis]|uniref:Uncharacterized protein n=1 Tax=Ophiocordyceps australis TaxID=1399860 RepID=A0A2C5Y2P4_9HYPO|nr:hypothetical protein CDD81_719 [Ophiocordyceps australis]